MLKFLQKQIYNKVLCHAVYAAYYILLDIFFSIYPHCVPQLMNSNFPLCRTYCRLILFESGMRLEEPNCSLMSYIIILWLPRIILPYKKKSVHLYYLIANSNLNKLYSKLNSILMHTWVIIIMKILMQSQAKYLLSQTSNKAFLVNWAFIFCLSYPTLHTTGF